MPTKRKQSSSSVKRQSKKQKRRVARTRADDDKKLAKKSFLDLPPELRVRVYGYLFPDKKVPARRPSCMSRVESRKTLRKDGKPCFTAIMSTCSQIYTETCDILYGSVTYEIDIEGEYIRACMYASVNTLASVLELYGFSSRAALSRARSINARAGTFEDRRATLFRYVRSVHINVWANARDAWSCVHQTALRKQMTDELFSSMFVAFDTPRSIFAVLGQLQSSIVWNSLHVTVSYRRPWRVYVPDGDVEWVLQPFKYVRVKKFSVGKLAQPVERNSWTMETKEQFELRQQAREAIWQSFMDELAAQTTSNESPDEMPVERTGGQELRAFVRQFHGQHFFHEMCKELYRAVLIESKGDLDRFKIWQERVIKVWMEEKARLQALMAVAETPLLGMNRLQDSKGGGP